MWFDLAKDIARAHAAEYLGDVCPVCERFEPLCECQLFDESRAESDAEELRLFDREEARAINGGTIE